MKYETVEGNEYGDKIAIRLLNNPYDGIILTLGEVSFSEEGEECKMHYHYDVEQDNGKEYIKEDLEKLIGDILIEAIEDGLKKNSLIYSGGTDGENREDNFIESDSQRGILS